jgi:hypothetical protein
VHPKAISTNDEAKNTRVTARGLPAHDSSSNIQTSREPEAETQKTTRVQEKREWGGMVRLQSEAVPLIRSVVSPVSHAEEKTHHKLEPVRRPRSPDVQHHRKRSREDDTRPDKVSKALSVAWSNFSKHLHVHRMPFSVVLSYMQVIS